MKRLIAHNTYAARTRLELLRSTGRHIPASHPLLRSLPMPRPLPEQQASMAGELTDRIEAMAVTLAHLPDVALTEKQRELLRTIARELLRRVEP